MRERNGERNAIQEVLGDLEVRIEAYLCQLRLEFGIRKESEKDMNRDEPRLRALDWRRQQ